MGHIIHGPNTEDAGIDEIDEELCHRVITASNTEDIVEEFQQPLDKAYRITRTIMTTKKEPHHKSVPWWTQRLTILRKR